MTAQAGRRGTAPGDATVVAVIVALVVAINQLFVAGDSPDLLALWTAAQSIAAGRFDSVYAGSEDLFRMVPPVAWLPHLDAQGFRGQVFPYVYPPLWAWLLAPVTRVADFATVVRAASVANPVFLCATALLAWRATARRLSPQAWLTICLAIYLATIVGSIALYQNQPQILVALLTLGAMDRSRAGSAVPAGLCLGLAAGIKILPGLLAVIWIAQGRWREAGVFAVTVAAIGVASVALAGWPLNLAFLHEVSAVSHTLLGVTVNLSLPSTLSGLVDAADATSVEVVTVPPGTMPGAVWSVLRLGPAGQAVVTLEQLAVLAGLVALARARGDTASAGLVWAVGAAAIAFASPIAWSYYFIAPVAFAPLLVERFGAPKGGALLIALFLPGNMLMRIFLPGVVPFLPSGPLSVLGMLIFTSILLSFALGRRA